MLRVPLIDRADRAYFERDVEHLFELPGVEYIGEIGESEKPGFLAAARALLFPIDWEEPFGMVMIEAMACGTPVIAFNRGSVPEIVEEGFTGFIVEDEQGAIGAVDRLARLSRTAIRKRFEERFTARRMAQDYLATYRSLMEAAQPRLRLIVDDESEARKVSAGDGC